MRSGISSLSSYQCSTRRNAGWDVDKVWAPLARSGQQRGTFFARILQHERLDAFRSGTELELLFLRLYAAHRPPRQLLCAVDQAAVADEDVITAGALRIGAARGHAGAEPHELRR